VSESLGQSKKSASVEPSSISASESAPVGRAGLPARMVHFMELRGIQSLAELALWHPAQLLCEPNLGHKTIADTRSLLEDQLDCVWEDLALGDAPPPLSTSRVSQEFATGSERIAWDALRHALPADALARSLLLVELPSRLRQLAASQGMNTVADLVAWPARELLAKRNLGRTSLNAAHELLIELADASGVGERPVAVVDWKRLLLDGLALLALRERMVLTQRAGLAGPAPTLTQLGVSLGVSRERIRQLESAAVTQLRRSAPWLLRLAPLLDAIVPAFAIPLLDLQVDGRLIVPREEEDGEPFAFLLSEVLQGQCGQLFVADGIGYYGRVSCEEFDAALARLRAAAANLAYPLELAALADELQAEARLNTETVRLLLPLIQTDFITELNSVTGFGRRRATAILALLRAASGGVSVSQIAQRCGRGPLPSEVVWLDRGLVSLPEMIPSYDVWQLRVAPLVIQIMSEHGETREWTTAELVPLLSEVADLPTWFNAYTLGSLLKNAEGVAYLGRNVVALAAAAPSERTYLMDALTAILLAAGRPIPDTELLAKLRAQRGMADNTWSMLRMRAPFLLLGDNQVGLRPRDLPGGDDAASAFCDSVFTLLERAEHGFGTADLQAAIAQQPAPINLWDVRLARSVLRHDSRFRQAHGGGLGLAIWGATRTPVQAAILTDLLTKSTRLPVATALDALSTSSGEPLPRNRLASVAASCDARISGEYVEWDSPMPLNETPTTPEGATSETSSAADPNAEPPAVRAKFSISEVQELHRLSMRVPEKAAGLFLLYMYTARKPAKLAEALTLWRATLDATKAPGIDHHQVDRLTARTTRLLTWLTAAERPKSHYASVCAAVEYVVHLDDGKGDELVGGLDDDEGVLSVVERAVGVGALGE
jgi:Sigma-70, region 4